MTPRHGLIAGRAWQLGSDQSRPQSRGCSPWDGVRTGPWAAEPKDVVLLQSAALARGVPRPTDGLGDLGAAFPPCTHTGEVLLAWVKLPRFYQHLPPRGQRWARVPRGTHRWCSQPRGAAPSHHQHPWVLGSSPPVLGAGIPSLPQLFPSIPTTFPTSFKFLKQFLFSLFFFFCPFLFFFFLSKPSTICSPLKGVIVNRSLKHRGECSEIPSLGLTHYPVSVTLSMRL